MAILSNYGLIGHKPYDYNYSQDGYPWKNNGKTKLPVKKSSDLDVWKKSYDPKFILYFFGKNNYFFKNQK